MNLYMNAYCLRVVYLDGICMFLTCVHKPLDCSCRPLKLFRLVCSCVHDANGADCMVCILS